LCCVFCFFTRGNGAGYRGPQKERREKPNIFFFFFLSFFLLFFFFFSFFFFFFSSVFPFSSLLPSLITPKRSTKEHTAQLPCFFPPFSESPLFSHVFSKDWQDLEGLLLSTSEITARERDHFFASAKKRGQKEKKEQLIKLESKT